MENLKTLDSKRLSEIIKSFDGKLFQSEAQFQFELAWKLKEVYGDNIAVYLEDMRAVMKNEKGKITQKFYTDIVVEQGDYCVAIELKYKTAEFKNKDVQLSDHAAVDLGKYDYLWDVHRVELLTGLSKPNNKVKGEELEILKKCQKGFAVLLTNEEKYWEGRQGNKITIDYQFSIGEKNGKLSGKVLDWKKTGDKYPATVLSKNGNPTGRAQPIKLKTAYHYTWSDYREAQPGAPEHGTFRFVIIEVDGE